MGGQARPAAQVGDGESWTHPQPLAAIRARTMRASTIPTGRVCPGPRQASTLQPNEMRESWMMALQHQWKEKHESP